MSGNIQIKYLAEVPQYLPILAQWTYEAWGKYDPTLSIENAADALKAKLNTNKIPLTFVAISDDKPVGMVSLKPKIKVEGYSDRDLWLGSFWIIDGYRGLGIGTQLLDKAISKAQELGFKKISLFASDPTRPAWYKKHGWREFATDTYQNHQVVLMERPIP